ncbi:MAG: hypothetical protein GJU76_02425 [Gallionella sp.]|jgi:hypothetical protein|nr:hypothetical protein [Gallionella sp.]
MAKQTGLYSSMMLSVRVSQLFRLVDRPAHPVRRFLRTPGHTTGHQGATLFCGCPHECSGVICDDPFRLCAMIAETRTVWLATRCRPGIQSI